MSKFEDKLIGKIKEENIKPLPKSYFTLVKSIFEICLVGLALGVIYLINLSFYLPRRGMGRGGFGPGRIDMLLSSIPWSYVLIGVLGIAIIIWMIYRYTGAYKTKLIVIIGLISSLILLGGFALSLSNLNERLEKKRHFQQIYKQNMMEKPMMQRNNFNKFR